MNYKKATISILTMAIGIYFTLKSISTSKVDNYLYIGQHSLSNHLLSSDQTNKEKIIFLGSSAVAGNNIPPHSTLTDYFNQENPLYQAYNLATLQANLLDANIILSIYKNKLLNIAILGIDPSVLLENQLSLFSKSHSKSADPELKIKMENYLHASAIDQIEIQMHEEPVPPTSFQIWWKSSFLKIRNNFWGPLFNKKLYGEERKLLKDINAEANPSWQLIDTFIKTSKENNIRPVLFIEPILDSVYSKKEFAIFKNRLKAKSEILNFSLFDYSSLLPSTHDYFYDFVHLTPNGYAKLANRIKKDLVENNIIKGKVL